MFDNIGRFTNPTTGVRFTAKYLWNCTHGDVFTLRSSDREYWDGYDVHVRDDGSVDWRCAVPSEDAVSAIRDFYARNRAEFEAWAIPHGVNLADWPVHAMLASK